MHDSIRELDDEIARLGRQRELLLRELQATCQHELISGCDYGLTTQYSPIRVCENCGLYEREWLGSFWVLNALRIRQVSREEIFRMRTGFNIDEHVQRSLLRKTATIEQLIRTAT